MDLGSWTNHIAQQSMVSCAGQPGKDCPNRSRKKEVLPCQGELFLCEVCEYVRFKELSTRKPKPASTATTPKSASTPAKTEVVGSVKSTPGTAKSNSKSCKHCTKRLNETVDKPLTCGRCEHWSCRTCAKLTLAEYDVITKKASKVHWFCMDCDEEAMAAVKASSQLFKEYTEQVNCRLDKMEGNLTNKADGSVFVDLCKRVDALSALVEELRGKPVSPPSNRDTEAELLAVNEIEEREKRSNNIMIFNLPESPAATSDETANKDKEKIDEIGQILGAVIETTKTVRIGKKETGKVRPLKVILPNRTARDALLSKAKNLRKSEEEMAKNLVMKMDLTPTQRLEEKKLLVERNKRREEDKANGVKSHTWIIRKGKIIKIKIAQQIEERVDETNKEQED